MSKTFIKTIENFRCEKCGYEIVGSGYTNHCPMCLWSKHVDVFPGDRQEKCGGLMKPVRVEKKKNAYAIIHKCEMCGEERKNKTSSKDDFEQIVKIS